MTTIRPITTSFPLGLFCTATLSLLPPNPPEAPSAPLPMDRQFLDMPAIAPESDGLNEDIYWDEDSA